MQVIELLKEAKSFYIEKLSKGTHVGMCWCIKIIANEHKSRSEQSNKGHVPYNSIVAQIPEFNPEFLEVTNLEKFKKNTYLQVGLEFWWDIMDSDSRINAFDKLIKLYERTDKEFVW